MLRLRRLLRYSGLILFCSIMACEKPTVEYKECSFKPKCTDFGFGYPGGKFFPSYISLFRNNEEYAMHGNDSTCYVKQIFDYDEPTGKYFLDLKVRFSCRHGLEFPWIIHKDSGYMDFTLTDSTFINRCRNSKYYFGTVTFMDNDRNVRHISPFSSSCLNTRFLTFDYIIDQDTFKISEFYHYDE